MDSKFTNDKDLMFLYNCSNDNRNYSYLLSIRNDLELLVVR